MIEELVTRLVHEAPHVDGKTVEDLRAALWANGSPLALSIARIVELVADGLVHPGIALPALAEACATLVASRDPKVLEAARYQIETLQPMPDPPPAIGSPDVPLSSLASRGPRRQT